MVSSGADSVTIMCSAEVWIFSTWSIPSGIGSRGVAGTDLNPPSRMMRSGTGRLVTVQRTKAQTSVSTSRVL